MNKCPQNSANTTENTLEDQVIDHILVTVNNSIALFNEHSTSTFYIYCEEQLTTLLPLARMLPKFTSAAVANQMASTIDLMQRGEEIGEIMLGIA